ncbi:MAG: Metallo-beta-lactamase family protein [Bacteroidetes bacterium]|jgi:7,8-dihydropterin-6-yl-methyl-4-(beta-D-ribofuranosyl)aminobenzene 5'-phosphate synthase|nr:Metallo-beta-lactamase family protein [Bacteroidota bacterium]
MTTIAVLSDNRTANSTLLTEHGLAVLLDTGHRKWLLDTGASDLFMQNARAMNLNMADVDAAFVSHGHADHLGGLIPFLESNIKAKVVVSKQAITGEFYSVRSKPRDLTVRRNFSPYKDRFLTDFKALENESVYILKVTYERHRLPRANSSLFIKKKQVFVCDDFLHELVFVYDMPEGLFVFSGCSHKGLLNVLDTVKANLHRPVRCLLGGFHLPDGEYESDAEIEHIASSIKLNYPLLKLYTGHCTGNHAFSVMKKILQDQLTQFYAGFTLII